MSPGAQATQATHAAFAFSQEWPDITGPWFRDSNYLVLLCTTDEDSLCALAARVESAGIPHLLTREPDFGNEATALAVAPSREAERIFGSLPLLGREAVAV